MNGAERDLGRQPQSEHQQYDRIKCDFRQAVDRDEDRPGHLSGGAVETERQTNRKTAADRQQQRDCETPLPVSRACGQKAALLSRLQALTVVSTGDVNANGASEMH